MRTFFSLLFVFSVFLKLEAISSGDVCATGGYDVTTEATHSATTEVQCPNGLLKGTSAVKLSGGGAFSTTNINLLDIQVNLKFDSTGTHNFFSAGGTIKLTGKEATPLRISFVNKAVLGTLFYANGGVFELTYVTVDAFSLGSGYFFTMNSASTNKNIKFTNLRMLGLDKSGSQGVFALSQTRNKVLFENCAFQNFNIADAVIDESAPGLEVKGTNFTSIKTNSSRGGSCFHVHHNTEKIVELIENCVFDKCTSTHDKGSGGAIHYNTASSSGKCPTLHIKLCTVTYCKSENEGGFIYATNNGKINATNCTFDHCTSKNNGGVLMAGDYKVEINTVGITFQSCIVQYCSSTSGSGGVCYYRGGEHTLYDSYFLLLHCDFFYCNCAVDGGVGYFYSGGKCRTNESVFYNCTAGLYGGAIKMHWSGMELANCTFSKCFAKYGGACNFLMNVALNFYDCLLYNCQAAKFGGAVAFQRRSKEPGEYPSYTMLRCYLTGNSVLDPRGYGLDVVFMEDYDTETAWPNWGQYVVRSNFSGTYSKTEGQGYSQNGGKGFKVYAFNNNNNDFSSFIGLWDPVPVLTVSLGGTNSKDGCGYSGATFRECRDIAYASSRINIAFAYTIDIRPGTYYESLITVQLDKILTVWGHGRDPLQGGTHIIPQYDPYYSALFICHYPNSGLILKALSFEQSNPNYGGQIRSAVYLNTPDTTGFLEITDCFFNSTGAQLDGCLIYSMGHDVTVVDSTFDNFKTNAEHGGAIRFGRKKATMNLNLIVVNSEFISCAVDNTNKINGGGAVFVESSAITNFTLVRFEYGVGRALVFDYGTSSEQSYHTFDKCVFVHNQASSDNPSDFKGSALACLNSNTNSGYVTVYFDHCYFGDNKVDSIEGRDAGFISSSTGALAPDSNWDKLVSLLPGDKEAEYFWDCLSDGEKKRLWTTSSNEAYLASGNEDPGSRYRMYLNHTYRDDQAADPQVAVYLRVSHTSVGFNGEYCGCDHVPCNTIAYAYTRTNLLLTLPSTYGGGIGNILWVARVVNNETATVNVVRKLILLKKDGQPLPNGKWRVSRDMSMEPTKVVVDVQGSLIDGPVLVYVSMNDSVKDFFRVKDPGFVEIGKTSIDDKFHFLHNSTGGDHSLFNFESTETSKLENVRISDGAGSNIPTINPRAGALTRGLVFLNGAGKVELNKVEFFSLIVGNGGAGIDVLKGELEFTDSTVTGIDGLSENACFLRVDGDGKATVTRIAFDNFNNVHVAILGSAGELTIDYCNFTEVHTVYNGSAILVGGLPVKTGNVLQETSGKLVVKNSIFSKCDTTAAFGCGGAIYVSLGESGTLDLSVGNTFKNCMASVGYGGAIFLYAGAQVYPTDFKFNGITFGTGGANSATKGNDIYVHAVELREIVVRSKFTVPPQLDEVGFVGTLNVSLGSATHIPLVYLFYPYSGPAIYINLDGYDRFWCGRKILPCITVTEANTKTDTSVSASDMPDKENRNHHLGVTEFILDGTVQLQDLLLNNPAGKRLVSKYNERTASSVLLQSPLKITSAEVKGKLQLNSPAYSGADYLYKCAGLLNFTGIDIVPATKTLSLSGAGSSLVLINCQIGGSATAVATVLSSVFELVGDDIIITNSNFSYITSSLSAAVAVHAEISNGKSFTILNSTFLDCKSTLAGGSGGALFVKLEDAVGTDVAKFTIEENYYSGSTTTFKNCDVGSGGKGGAIYLSLGVGAKYVFGGLLKFDPVNYPSSGSGSTVEGSHIYVESKELSRAVITRDGFKYVQYVSDYSDPLDPTINGRYKKLGDKTLQGVTDPAVVFPDAPLLRNLKPYLIDLGSEVYVKHYDENSIPLGRDFHACGPRETPCATIQQAVTNAAEVLTAAQVRVFKPSDSARSFDFKFPAVGGWGKLTKIDIVGIDVSATDDSNPRTIDAIATSGINAVVEVTGSLSFTQFAVTALSSVGKFINVINNGFLNVTGGSFSAISTSEQVIVITGGGALFTGVSFSSITSTMLTGGTGSALFATVASGKTLRLIDCNFNGCKTGANSYGGAIHVSLKIGGIFSVSGTSEAKPSTFEGNGDDDTPGDDDTNGLTKYGGAIFLDLQTGFSLDMSGSRPSYFEFVGYLDFSESNKNKAFCGYNIFINHTGGYEEVINRQSFDFLVTKIENGGGHAEDTPCPCAYAGIAETSGECTTIENFIISSDPVYVKDNIADGTNPVGSNADLDALDAIGNAIKIPPECSRKKPCYTIEKAIERSGGTFTDNSARSVNVKLISPGPTGGFPITVGTTSSHLQPSKAFPGHTSVTTVSSYSFKGIAVNYANSQETAARVLLFGGSDFYQFVRKLSFENIIFRKASSGKLFVAPGSDATLTLANCLVDQTGPSSLSTGLFEILSDQFMFSSKSAVQISTGVSVTGTSVITIGSGTKAGVYTFSNAVFNGITLSVPLLSFNCKGELIVLSCDFNTITTTTLFEITGGKRIAVSNSSFKSITLNGGAAAALSINLALGADILITDNGELAVADSTFKTITGGKVILVTAPDSSNVKLNFSGLLTFKDCSASEGGNITLHAQTKKLPSRVNNQSFSYLSELLTKDFYEFIIPQLNAVVGDGDNLTAVATATVSLFYYLLDNPTPVFASPLSVYDTLSVCGFFTYPCKDFDTAIERSGSASGSVLTINVVAPLNPSPATAFALPATLPAATTTTTPIKTIPGYIINGSPKFDSTQTYLVAPLPDYALLSIPNGITSSTLSLALNFIKITGSASFTFSGSSSLSFNEVEISAITTGTNIITYSASEPLNIVSSNFSSISLSGSVIKITGGSPRVVVDTATFTSIATSGEGAAIYTSPDSIRSLVVKKSVFDTCTSTKGGALYVNLPNLAVFEVEGGSFKDCSAGTTGYGGGIYLKLGSGFNRQGNSTNFVFNESTGNLLTFASTTASNIASNGRYIFVDGSEGIDLSEVVSDTPSANPTFNFAYLATTLKTDGHCNDWMGFDKSNTGLTWLNRYFDNDDDDICYLYSDGCPSGCVKKLNEEVSPIGVTCVNESSCKLENGEDYCIQEKCGERKPKPVGSPTIISGTCYEYTKTFTTRCGDGCYYDKDTDKCIDQCPVHSFFDGTGECIPLSCEHRVVCPDGKVFVASKSESGVSELATVDKNCVNDTCVGRVADQSDPSKCEEVGLCKLIQIVVKDAFGVKSNSYVCRSVNSFTVDKSITDDKACGSDCYLNATDTDANKCILTCTEKFYVENTNNMVCEKESCEDRSDETDTTLEHPCGQDCYYFADHDKQDVESTKTTTTKNTTSCMDYCPEFYYALDDSTICVLKNCSDRGYTAETGCTQEQINNLDCKLQLTCGPDCFFKNHSTSCNDECNPNRFKKYNKDNILDSESDGWGYCELIPCSKRTPDEHDLDANGLPNCKEDGDQCFTDSFDKCDENNGNYLNSEYKCAEFPKELDLLVGGKNAVDIHNCGSGNRANCKTLSYAVGERSRQSCVRTADIPTIKLTADVIETARNNVSIDITGIHIKSQSIVKRLTVNMAYRASFVISPWDRPTTITNLIFNTFTIRGTLNYRPLFFTTGVSLGGTLTFNGVVINYAVSRSLAETPTLDSFTAWVVELSGITVNFTKSLINNRNVGDLSSSAYSLSSLLSSSSYRLTRLDLSVMFDLDFSDDPEFEAEFLDRFSSVIVSLVSSNVASRSRSLSYSSHDYLSSVCIQQFPNPAVLLTDLNGSFVYSNFSNINTGAIKLANGANVTLDGVAFNNNTHHKSVASQSMRHNVFVSSGTTLTVVNLIAESSGSFFLQSEDGTPGVDDIEGVHGDTDGKIIGKESSDVDSRVITPFNELFTPIFTDSSITPSDDGASFVLTLRGGMFFNCDPTLVLYRGDDVLGRYPKEEFTISGESSLTVNVSQNSDSYLETIGEYQAQLLYEPHQRSARYTFFTRHGIPPQKSKANLKPLWWILVALGIIILLLIALVIFLYIRMKLKQKELEQDAAEARIRAQVRRDQQINKQRADQRKIQEKKTVKEPVKKVDRIFANDINSNEDSFGAWEAGADEWVVDARRCEHPFGVVQCDRRRTLFALYTELSAQALNTSSPQETFQSMLPQKLKNPMGPMLGLAQLMNRLYQENPNVPVDHISPHTLLVSTKGSLALVLKKDAVKNMTGEGREVGGAFESIRWNAPELKFEETPTLASDVFSYSLVAWQIATPMHEVPFAEVDAQSASTRMATGYRPVTQGLDYRLVGLFENAWKQEPDERSTVQEIIDTLQAGGSSAGGDQWDSDGSGKGGAWKAPAKKDGELLSGETNW